MALALKERLTPVDRKPINPNPSILSRIPSNSNYGSILAWQWPQSLACFGILNWQRPHFILAPDLIPIFLISFFEIY
jgi:hypothetical protein